MNRETCPAVFMWRVNWTFAERGLQSFHSLRPFRGVEILLHNLGPNQREVIHAWRNVGSHQIEIRAYGGRLQGRAAKLAVRSLRLGRILWISLGSRLAASI